MKHSKLTTDKLQDISQHDTELELDTLACIVWNADNYSKIMLLENEDFYSLANKELFKALRENYERDKVINPSSIAAGTKKDASFIQLINRSTVITTQVNYNIRRLKEITAIRSIQALAHKATLKTQQGDSPDNIKLYIEKAINEVSVIHKKKEVTTKELEERFDSMIEQTNENPTTSGFKKLDNVIGGFNGGTMNVIAAAPGVGKTTFAINLLNHFCGQLNKRVLYITLEMNFDTLYLWLVSRISGVPYFNIRYRRDVLTPEDWQAIQEARAKVSTYNQVRIGEERVSIDDIRYKIKEAIPEVVVIDYLQKIKNKDRYHNEYEGITNISNELSTMANEFNVPIIVLSSLSRKYADRPDGIPKISDIRGSGAIEHDAEMVFLLHREAAFGKYKNGDVNKFKHGGKLLIAKNRHGQSNKAIDIYFDGARVLIREAQEWEI